MSMHLVQISAAQTGFNGTVLPSVVGTNTNPIPCNDCSEVRFHFDLTRVASTNVQWLVQASDHDNPQVAPPAASWRTVKSESIVVGVGTLNTYSQIDTAAATRSFDDEVPCRGAKFLRLASLYGAGSTTDTLSVSATLVQER